MRNNLNRFRAFWRHFPAAGAINLALIILCILLIWELISSTIDNPSRYLPSPILVALSSVDMKGFRSIRSASGTGWVWLWGIRPM